MPPHKSSAVLTIFPYIRSQIIPQEAALQALGSREHVGCWAGRSLLLNSLHQLLRLLNMLGALAWPHALMLMDLL